MTDLSDDNIQQIRVIVREETADMRSDTSQLNHAVSDLYGKVEGIENKITTIDAKIIIMDAKITTMDERITTMDGQIRVMNKELTRTGVLMEDLGRQFQVLAEAVSDTLKFTRQVSDHSRRIDHLENDNRLTKETLSIHSRQLKSLTTD